MWISLSILLYSSAHLVSSQLATQQVKPCRNNEGSCRALRDCPWGKDAIRQGIRPEICSFSGVEPIICCLEQNRPASTSQRPQTTNRPNPTAVVTQTERTGAALTGRVSQRKCREYAQYVYELQESPAGLGTVNESTCSIEAVSLIVGGIPAEPKEFPHMALIGYGNSKKISWHCGGSLISEKFVLSAAHCSNPSQVGPASWVKLGELDQSTEEDDAAPLTLRIIETIDHPDYLSPRTYNDISLFRLETKVKLSSYIRPICLHDGRDLPSDSIVSGWGHTEFRGRASNHLQKVEVKMVSQRDCNISYRVVGGSFLPDGIQESSQICAGEPGKDSCQGDSGGPLQMILSDPFCMYMQIGITSFGRGCGKYPGVYTRVSMYVDWIEKIVWPNE